MDSSWFVFYHHHSQAAVPLVGPFQPQSSKVSLKIILSFLIHVICNLLILLHCHLGVFEIPSENVLKLKAATFNIYSRTNMTLRCCHHTDKSPQLGFVLSCLVVAASLQPVPLKSMLMSLCLCVCVYARIFALSPIPY